MPDPVGTCPTMVARVGLLQMHLRRLVRPSILMPLLLVCAAALAPAQEWVFEAPAEFASSNRRFPQTASTDSLAVVAYQRISDQNDAGGLIDLEIATSPDGLIWSDRGAVVSGLAYEGRAVPPVYSLAVAQNNEILLAVTAFEKISAVEGRASVQIHRSIDGGESFALLAEAVRSELTLVAPVLSQRADGGWFLFLEYLYEGSASRLVMTRSDDAIAWDDLVILPVDNRIQNQVDLTHEIVGGRDVVVFSGENFTSLNAGFDEDANAINPLAATFHLMGLFSADGGETWSAVDPGTDQPFARQTGLTITQSDDVDEVGREVEELDPDVIPYWYLRVSDVGLPESGVQYGDIVSRRPDVGVHRGEAYVAWEAGVRRESDNVRQAVIAPLDVNANLSGPVIVLSDDRITRRSGSIAYNQPTVVSVGARLAVIAYNDPTRRGDVVLFEEREFGWSEQTVSAGGVATFPAAVASSERLHVFWQERETNEVSSDTRIVYLEPDQSARPPVVAGLNYEIGRRSRLSLAEFTWSAPPDASGIVGYSYTWGRDTEEAVPLDIRQVNADAVSFEADADGEWYFRIRAVDRLGNWSEPDTVVFYRDTTPPGLVRFLPPILDEDGYLASNTFSLEWDEPGDDVIGGYSYDLVYVADEDAEISREDLPVPVPPARIITDAPVVRQNNFDNGLWALSVAAIDSVGNIGDPSVLFVRMNKYIPVTEIVTVAAVPDLLGRYAIDIVGRGFTANGNIVQVVLDTDQQAPFDYVFDSASPGFRVFTDRSMSGPILDDIATGTYWFGLVHAERGLDWDNRQLVLERNGTVKFGDYTVIPGARFLAQAPRFGFLGSVGALAWVVIGLLGAVIVFSSTRIVAIVRDGRYLRLEARALVTRVPAAALDRPERMKQMKRRGIGLFAKFAFFVVVVVMAVVTMLAFGLGTATLNNQRRILLQGLEDNVNVLMESIVLGAAVLLPEPEINIVGLADLPRRTGAMDEALFATITGRASSSAGVVADPGYNYVWSTNDPLIQNAGEAEYEPEDPFEIRAFESIQRSVVPDAEFDSGDTVIFDPVTDVIDNLAGEIDELARDALGDLPRAIDDTFNRILELAGATFDTEEERIAATAEADRQRLVLAALNQEANAILADIVGGVRSYPEFNPETFTVDQRDFIFYQSIVYLPEEAPADLDTAQYANGAVRIAVSTDLIVDEIASARRTLIRLTFLIALAAIAAGIVGAVLLAAIVVRPIRRLVQHVQKISDTADKRDLAEHVLTLRSRDELAQLADTVNEMNHGLVTAANQDEELKVSSDMQKRFMPLEAGGVTQDAPRLTSAHAEVGDMEFHGYYEGADALSGDFFSFNQLDERQYAVVKCDVSGHGVLAAIIMVEVATVYLNQLRDWVARRKKLNLTDLLFTINDLVEQRGFFGRFAAMTVGILDVQSGKLRVSHAGDEILQVYRVGTGKVEQRILDRAPATGVFDADMVEATGQGFKEVAEKLDPGDVLILATDGIDESKRFLRGHDFEPIVVEGDEAFEKLCEEQGWGGAKNAKDELGIGPEENFVTEDFTLPRMHAVIESILSRREFVLERAMYPDADERAVFDFGGVDPTAENVALGLMAVEKIYRLYRHPGAGERDLVKVDSKINDFLKGHFSLYYSYFRNDVPRPDSREEYVWFSHLREEEQRDDLTILVVRRKD